MYPRNLKSLQSLQNLRASPHAADPNFLGFLVSTHFPLFVVKNTVFGVRDYHQCIRIEIWSHIQVSMPQIEFSEAISD